MCRSVGCPKGGRVNGSWFSPPLTVRKRKVIYIPGYDPFPPRRYRELYRKEGAKQAALSGYELELAGRNAGAAYGWRATAQIDGEQTEVDFDVLLWSDIVQKSMSNTVFDTYWRLLRTSWTYIATGALGRLATLPKGPLAMALYPVVMLLVQLQVAVLLGYLGATLIGQAAEVFIPSINAVNATGISGGLALFCGSFLTIIGLVLGRFKAHDRHLHAYFLMNDFAFSAGLNGATPPALQDRMNDFRDRISEALAQDYDEVLVVGHSSGAHLAVSVLADLLRRDARLANQKTLSFLSLGHVVPMVSFLPDAHQLRADLQYLSEANDVVWIDVTAPGDGCTFALCDPVSTAGVATERKKWPLVFSAQFSRSMGEEKWRKMRRKYYRLHFQYLCAFDHPLDYDYFQITAGPVTLGDRYSGRVPSKNRIDHSVSKYTSIRPARQARPGRTLPVGEVPQPTRRASRSSAME